MRLSPLRGVVVALVVGVVGALLLARRRSRPRPARTARPARVPVVALLGLVVVAAATFRLLLGRAATEPRVFGDELVYSGLAKGFALEGQPLFRGEVDLAHSMLYPLLIAPAHVLGADGARAFEATKAMNAVVVASAAVPAYLLARRVVTPLFALAVAFLVAFEPWTAYASLVMTESLFLPAFTTFVLLLARMLDRPTLGRQLAVLASLALLAGIRPQGVALVGAVLGAVAINGLRAPPFRRTLVVYRPLLAGLGVGLGAAVVAMALGDDAPGGVSGGVLEGLLDPVGLLTWSSWTVAVFGLALGVVALVLYPFALGSLLRSPVERDRATGVALLTSSLALLLSVAAVSASPYGLDVLHERYLFYLTPLVLVGLGVPPRERPRAVRSRALDCRARRDRGRSEPAGRPGRTGEQRRQPDRCVAERPPRGAPGRAGEGARRRPRRARGRRPRPLPRPARAARRRRGGVHDRRGRARLLGRARARNGAAARLGRSGASRRRDGVARAPRVLATRPALRSGGGLRAAGPRRPHRVLQHARRQRVPSRERRASSATILRPLRSGSATAASCSTTAGGRSPRGTRCSTRASRSSARGSPAWTSPTSDRSTSQDRR